MSKWWSGLILVVGCGGVFAQDTSTTERLRLIEAERQEALQPRQYLELPRSPDSPFDIGGWTTLTFIDFREDDHISTAPDPVEGLFLQDYRLWMKGGFTRETSYYLRLRHLEFGFQTAVGVPTPNTERQSDAIVDLGYVEYRPTSRWMHRFGRQFVRAGRGLSLATDLDGVDNVYQGNSWSYRLFLGKTINRDSNIDTSIVGFNEGNQDRFFYMGSGEYRTEDGDRYYGYALSQRDESDSDDPAQRLVDFHYHSNYYGLGTEGSFNPEVHYFFELIQEGGDTLADFGTRPRVEIDATGITSGLLYYPDWAGNPFLSLEYASGSGDPRRGSVTNVLGGKQTAERDQNFLYFGVYDAGLALSPRLSNLHVLRVGYQARPLPKDNQVLPDLLAGGKLSLYRKDSKDGVISDPSAIMASDDVGEAIDLFVGYKPLSDTSFLVQYGQFWPGAAYAPGGDHPSTRVLASFNLNL